MWPDMNYKDFSTDIKKREYYFQCKHAGKRKNKRKR